MIYVMRTQQNAILPTVATPGSVGLDLYSTEYHFIEANQRAVIGTGIAAKIPHGYEGQIRGRSGFAAAGILCHAGTIDPDYTGEIKVILFNIDHGPVEINEGDRIAQMVVSPVAPPAITPVLALPETQRGNGGFGSTGR